MNIKKVVLLLCISLIISSCTTSSSPSSSGWFGFGNNDLQGGSDTPKTGNGLEINLKLDDNLLPKLRYDLTLKNTGDKMIEVQMEEFIFTTEQRINGQIIFTQESLTAMYNKIFSQGNILQVPPSGKELVISGSLSIIPEYYKDLTNQGFTYHINVKYDYTTEFDNNVQLDLEKYEIKTDRPSQAAPVKMNKLEILPTEDDSYFQLIYTIVDSSSSFDQTLVQIEDLDIFFGSQSLSCRYFYEDKEDYIETQEPILSELYSSLLVVCDVYSSDFDLDSITTTKTSGSFSYQYTIKEFGDIKFNSESRSLGIN
jgi:hypothetical protein